MKDLKNNLDDLLYLVDELQASLDRARFEIPEDFHKVLLDLLYHQRTILKGVMKEYDTCIKTGDDSLCIVYGLSRK